MKNSLVTLLCILTLSLPKLYGQYLTEVTDTLLTSTIKSYIHDNKINKSTDVLVVYQHKINNDTTLYIIRTELSSYFFYKVLPLAYTQIDGAVVTFYSEICRYLKPDSSSKNTFYKFLATKLTPEDYKLLILGKYEEIIYDGGYPYWILKISSSSYSRESSVGKDGKVSMYHYKLSTESFFHDLK